MTRLLNIASTRESYPMCQNMADMIGPFAHAVKPTGNICVRPLSLLVRYGSTQRCNTQNVKNKAKSIMLCRDHDVVFDVMHRGGSTRPKYCSADTTRKYDYVIPYGIPNPRMVSGGSPDSAKYEEDGCSKFIYTLDPKQFVIAKMLYASGKLLACDYPLNEASLGVILEFVNCGYRVCHYCDLTFAEVTMAYCVSYGYTYELFVNPAPIIKDSATLSKMAKYLQWLYETHGRPHGWNLRHNHVEDVMWKDEEFNDAVPEMYRQYERNNRDE